MAADQSDRSWQRHARVSVAEGVRRQHASYCPLDDRYRQKGRRTTQTQFVGGDTTVTRCLYTFLTAWNPSANGWIVAGIREPSLECALGDLS
jgi:hypothetical protein